MRALFTSASGMIAQQMNLDVIANNLANVNTTGYKRSVSHFQDLLYQTLRVPGSLNASGGQLPTGSQVGLGVSAGTTNSIFAPGSIQPNTGGDYDMAIRGEGFFKVLMPDGTSAYTRDGSLTVDSTGNLVTQEGYKIIPEIVIPPTKQTVSVLPDGTVSVTLAGQNSAQSVGTINLSKFANPGGLQRLGGNLFQATQASGEATDEKPGTAGMGTIAHKSLESSNVEVVEEMIRMITVQRAYETNSKSVQAADEMLQGANNLKR